MVIGPTQKSRLAVTNPLLNVLSFSVLSLIWNAFPTLFKPSSSPRISPRTPPVSRLPRTMRMFLVERLICSPMTNETSPTPHITIWRTRSGKRARRNVPTVLPTITVMVLMSVPVIGLPARIALPGTAPEQRPRVIAGLYGGEGGVANLTKELAIEYAPHSITVNAIAPGFFHTNIMVASGYSEQETAERYERLKDR